jgi:hydrophobic/amphiphilic exporter-1 (mainly G- bacteria), HAE1 family
MFISELAIRRPVVTVVAVLVLVILGSAAYWRLHTDEFPDVQPPVVVVSIAYPGAPPEIVEREVVEPIEERIAGLGDVERLTSSSLDSRAVITAQFPFDKDLQEAVQQIRDLIASIREDLPADMAEPVITRLDPVDLPVVLLTLSSTQLSVPELTRIADPGVTRLLRGIQGVADVRVVGGVVRELTVELRPDALRAAGISVAQVVEALKAQNLATPLGRVSESREERSIRLRGRLERPEQFGQLVVTQAAGRLVRLSDVATVRDGVGEPRSAALFGGAEAVGIEVVKSKRSSTAFVADAVRRQVHNIQQTLPSDAQLRIVRDAGTRVDDSVRDVQIALALGAVLTVITVFLFLNSWRSTVITAVALPISVLASFVGVWACGFTLNTMSLLGLSLAIGILIDDAIVVRENIVRHLEAGTDPVTAAHHGTDEIGLAVTATTLAIAVVFVPVAFMGGVAEQWFAPFALTIVCSVLVSWLVSFSVDPMLSAYWSDRQPRGGHRSRIHGALATFNAWFQDRSDSYETVVGWALDHRWSIIVLAVSSFAIGLALPAFGIVGGSFLPVHDVSEFTVVIEARPGSSLAYTKLKAAEVARRVRSRPEVAYTYATIGDRGSGAQNSASVDEAAVYVRLKPKAERDRHQEDIEQWVRRELRGVGGITSWISSDSVRNVKQIQVQVRGPDVSQLKRTAGTVADLLRQVPGVVDIGTSIKGPKPELEIQLDRALAGALGVTVEQIALALRPGFAGVDAGDWLDPEGETRDVMVRLPRDARSGIAGLETAPVQVAPPAGRPVMVPLRQLARIRAGVGPARIDHLDRARAITVQANTENRPLTDVIRDFDARAAGMALPAGYDISHGGEERDRTGVFRRILIALGIGLLLMYLVHVVQFGSFLDPVPVVLSLPLSLVGAMLALLVTGSTVNIMSMIGVILLMGIVAKNAILLIDFVKTAERNGLCRRSAIIEAGRVRLRPILMTTFAVLAGMLPVALGTGEGADFRAPLGRAVIGGVLTSTLLTLLVIPVAYEILSDWRDRAVARFRGTATRPDARSSRPWSASGLLTPRP